MVKKLFSHTAIYGLAPHAPKIASLFTLPIITQYLTPEDYGVAGVVLAYIGALSVLSTLGLRLILVNTFFKSPGQFKWAWKQIYGFLIFWSIPFGLLLGTVIYLVVPEVAEENRFLLTALNVLPVILFGPTAVIGQTFYQVSQKPLPIGIRAIVFGFLSVFLNLYTIAFLELGYLGWFWTAFIVNILSNLSYWYPLNFRLGLSPIFNFKWRLLKNSLKVSLPTIPHSYSDYLLNSSDRMVMSWLSVSAAEIGKYNIAYTIGSYVQQLGMASTQAVGPLLNEGYKNGDDKGARKLIFILQAFFFCLTFIVSLWLREIFDYLIRNEELSKMYPLAIIIVMSYNYRPIYAGSVSKLFFEGRTGSLWKISFVAGVGNLGLNFLLIPFFGFQVAAYTTFIALMYMGYSGFFFKDFKELNKVNYFPAYWFSGTIFLTGLAYYLVDYSLEIKAVITGILTLVAILFYQNFRKRLNQKKKEVVAA